MAERTHDDLASMWLKAIEDKMQHGDYGDVREVTTHAEVLADVSLVIAHALIDIADSLRNHLPGRVA
jgi:hypothetical protein